MMSEPLRSRREIGVLLYQFVAARDQRERLNNFGNSGDLSVVTYEKPDNNQDAGNSKGPGN
jgi:hypothetical protein